MNIYYVFIGHLLFGHWSFFPYQCKIHVAEMSDRVEMFCCVVMRAAVELLEAECLSGLLSLSFVGTQPWSLVSLSSATKLPPAGKLGPPSLAWFTR